MYLIPWQAFRDMDCARRGHVFMLVGTSSNAPLLPDPMVCSHCGRLVKTA